MDYMINAVLALPAVKPVLLAVVAWAVSLKVISMALETFAVALRPVVALTASKWDDKKLEVVIYWLDAVGDFTIEVGFMKWRNVYKVWMRIKEDLGKPYLERRQD